MKKQRVQVCLWLYLLCVLPPVFYYSVDPSRSNVWKAEEVVETTDDLHAFDEQLLTYMQLRMDSLSVLHSQVRETQRYPDKPPKEGQLQASDYVLIRNWDWKKLGDRWRGPYLVLLTTSTAAKVEGHPRCVHHSDCKKTAAPSHE